MDGSPLVRIAGGVGRAGARRLTWDWAATEDNLFSAASKKTYNCMLTEMWIKICTEAGVHASESLVQI